MPRARMNAGGRPYILERPTFYIGVDGRIRLSIPVLVFLWEKNVLLRFIIQLKFFP